MQRLLRLLGMRHGGEIMGLAAPTVLTMLSHTLMWTVNLAFLGHVSSLALGAAGLGGMITWAAYSLFNNLSRITSTFVAQANGEGDDPKAAACAWQGIYLAVAAGLLLTAAGWWSGSLLPLARLPADLESATAVYIRYRTLSAVGTQLTLALGGFYQGRKDVRTPMIAGMSGNVLNVALSYVLIFGWRGIPAMGVKGAALATSASVTLDALLLVIPLLASAGIRRRYRMHVPRPVSPRLAADLLRVGVPATLDNFADMLGFTLFSSYIGRGGAVPLAASQITIQLLSFSFMPMWGITVAGTVLVGNLIGERRVKDAERYAKEILVLSLAFCLALAAGLVLLGEPMFHIFTRDPAVLALAGAMAVVAGIFQFFDGMRMITLGILQGAGDTRVPMAISVAVLYAGFVPAAYVLTVVEGGGVKPAWIAGCVAYAVIAAGLFARYRSGRWKTLRIFSTSPPLLEPAPSPEGSAR